MKYDKESRRAISQLTIEANAMFAVIENFEQGEFIAFPELCSALGPCCKFIAFSCLSGSATGQKLGMDLGKLFAGRIKTALINFLEEMKHNSYRSGLAVLLDDCEPRRVWQWSLPQAEITQWYEMVIEDNKAQIPEDWEVILWSRIEERVRVNFEQTFEKISGEEYALIRYLQLLHMRKFPNKKLLGSVQEAVLRRIAEYALQGKIIREIFPHAILIQTETPWKVKDPLFSVLREIPLPIIHPYPEERR